jgi:phosphodiesterase/alkaline phosphatase D-like protein
MKILTIVFILSAFFSGCSVNKSGFSDAFPEKVKRIWIGPDYWANRLQDWQLDGGRMECIKMAANRNVTLLTVRLAPQKGGFNLSVKTGIPETDKLNSAENWLGWRIGIKGEFDDYRDDAVYGRGLNAGITAAGVLFIGASRQEQNEGNPALRSVLQRGLTLELAGRDSGGVYSLTLTARDERGKTLASLTKTDVAAQKVAGALALVSHFTKTKDPFIDGFKTWFDDISISGEKTALYAQRKFGPILFEQYTLSRGTLKMTAQLPPVGSADGKNVDFQIKTDKGGWRTLQKQPLDSLSRTAAFKIKNWDNKKDTPYRLHYFLNTSAGLKPFYRQGVIRKEPLEKDEFVLAAFTGNNDLGFPNNDLTDAVKSHNPDMLFFSGDQIYEGVGGYGVQRAPFDKAVLDYLRKWYLFGWAYGELLRDRPCVSIPDDHDVYHGNVWGDSGKAVPKGLRGFEAQDAGGYKMPAEWVNMVQRTQTSHLPDPYDSRPVLQGIGVYFTELNYGGVSFAILEDRKFKSAPKPLLPEARINNGWYQNRNWDPVRQGDAPGARLLGRRQLEFLEHWAGDWSNHTWMKAVLSQTIFANVATLPEGEYHDNVVPKLRILHKGEYPPDDRPVADMDSDGWPQTGRNKAVRALRKAFALHIAGDQHLGSVIQYGVDDWRDAGFAFCVPAISNIWPRRWFPAKSGLHRREGAPPYTGDFFDGFGNRITVLAVSNPYYSGKKPSRLYDRATGYGIIRFKRKSRDITMECWPRFVNPQKEPQGQYPGWPITINQLDNYRRKAAGWLPRIVFENMENAVVRVYSGKNHKLVYALRIKGRVFDPPVFDINDRYRLDAGNPDSGRIKVFENLSAVAKMAKKRILIRFD